MFNPPELKIENWELVEGYHDEITKTIIRKGVKGTVTNVGGDMGDLDFCDVQAKFYDKEDILLDTGSESFSELDSGETAKFEIVAYADHEEVDHASVEASCS
ncbi:FxLYD domain-containing protein [Candidatus Bipolaricaulota bacterium]|nr:FxLYD domain-containing protein [Candidatus Bipolaricaulota bacterium]